jgi:hypothetical protein
VTPYEVLGVSPKASPKEITDAYKTLAQIFHPDRHIDSPDNVRMEAERQMKRLNEAYMMAKKGGPAANNVDVHVQQKEAAWEAMARERVARAAKGVPWQDGVRARAQAEARAKEARRERERAKTNGQAVPRPKTRRDPQILYGMGEALYTNKLPCRECQSIQWLPDGWKDRLEDTNYFCSVCGRLLLSR